MALDLLYMEVKKNGKYIVASESVALDCLGYKVERDIKPGESIFIGLDKKIHFHEYGKTKKNSPCIFEYVYLARPDSVIDKINVYQSRLTMGTNLAKKIKKELTKEELNEIDVVMPIPDTSKTSALPLSIELNKKLREGFIKNRYIGRTFIMPGQKARKKSAQAECAAGTTGSPHHNGSRTCICPHWLQRNLHGVNRRRRRHIQTESDILLPQ